MSLEEKCKPCKGTGLDPNSYDEHIQSNGFMFGISCKFCVGTGVNDYADKMRNLHLLIFYALYNFKIARGDKSHLFYER